MLWKQMELKDDAHFPQAFLMCLGTLARDGKNRHLTWKVLDAPCMITTQIIPFPLTSSEGSTFLKQIN